MCARAMAAEDVLIGLIIGMVLLFLLNPMKGLVFIILNQRKQIDFLTHGNTEDAKDAEHFLNRKEES